jgi:DNA-binding protein Fis
VTLTSQGATWIVLLAWCGSALILFVGRIWLTSSIQKRVEHGFNEKVERLRSELRAKEENLKSELSAKEAEIASIRNSVFSSSFSRQAIVDKRRVEAVEKLWSSVLDLLPYKNVAAYMSVVKIGAVSARIATDQKLRDFFAMIGATAPAGELKTLAASREQPFVSPLAWGYFQAYSTIVLGSYAQLKAFELGLDKSEDLIAKDQIKKSVKAALPEFSKFIDEHDINSLYHLLDELEKRLLVELRDMLDGKAFDVADVTKAAEITEAVKSAEAQRRERAAAVAVGTPLAQG